MIKGFESLPLLNWLLVAAIGLTLMIALFSKFNQHPDEIHHFEAVKYYLNHFLPPVIGDPAVRASYSIWGDSYLNHYWVEYLSAGKFVRLLSFFGVNQLTAARLFQVLLLSGLSIFFIYRARTERQAFIFAAFLLITPQVWYIFSYINNDAFAFVISIILAYQLADTKSPFNKFIQAEKFKEQVFSGVLCGFLVGALFTGKTNYWVILIFIGLWVLFNYPLNVPALKRYAFILLVAASFVVLRIGADYYVNGETNFAGISYLNYVLRNYENSQGKLHAYQEEVADYSCKKSTLRNNLMASHESLKMRAKGVSFKDLFYKYEWHRLSFYSFVGL
jgi:hypothetical protein